MKMEIKGVTESVVQYLRDQIIKGDLNAGQRLNENHVSSKMGVSRPPLREAFRILEHERLVASIPRKGTRVTDLTLEDFHYVSQAREMIECFAIDLLEEQNITDLPEVEQAVADASLISMPCDNDREKQLRYFKTFSNFHVKLVDSAGNYWLSHFYHAIASNLARYQFMYFSIEGAAQRSTRQHRQVIEYIRQAAYGNSRECLRAHLRGTAELLKARILESMGEQRG
jgi:DNA-binding GntR family transcriptional regulator